MSIADEVFSPNAYRTDTYQELNQKYQAKMDDLFNRRQITYPMKQLRFEIQAITITSTLSQQEYLAVQHFVEAFPKKQKSGPAPVGGKDDYQGVTFYQDYRLYDATQYVVRSPLGFGYAVSKYLTISSQRQVTHSAHQVLVTIRIDPNRFLNSLAEPLINLLASRILPLLNHPRVAGITLTMDMPLIADHFHVLMTGEPGTHQQIVRALNAKQTYELTRIAYENPDHTKSLIVADYFHGLLEHQLIAEDTDYISAREAQYYQDHTVEPQYLTRIELNVATTPAVMRYMRNHEWLMRDTTIDYRDNNRIPRFEGTDYATHGKDFRRSFNRMLTYRLKDVQKRLRELPYLTDSIWQDTLG